MTLSATGLIDRGDPSGDVNELLTPVYDPDVGGYQRTSGFTVPPEVVRMMLARKATIEEATGAWSASRPRLGSGPTGPLAHPEERRDADHLLPIEQSRPAVLEEEPPPRTLACSLLAGRGFMRRESQRGSGPPGSRPARPLSPTSPGCQKPVCAARVGQIRTAASVDLEHTHEPGSCRSEPLWMSVGVTRV